MLAINRLDIRIGILNVHNFDLEERSESDVCENSYRKS